MLAAVVLSMLAADVSWCDDGCVAQSHPLTAKHGFGSPLLDYAFTLPPNRSTPRVHRLQASWVMPLGEPFELMGGIAYATDRRFELVPGMRWSVVKGGRLLIVAVAASAPLSMRAGVLELRVRPALEVKVGPGAMTFTLELDTAGIAPPRFWCGFQLSM